MIPTVTCFKQSETSRTCGYLCLRTRAGMLAGRAAGQACILQLLLIVQHEFDPLHAVDAATAL